MDVVRSWRLQQLRIQLETEDVAGIVLFDPLNIRYAVDATNMQVWCTHNAVRYAFVATDGPVILFDLARCEHLVEHLPPGRQRRREGVRRGSQFHPRTLLREMAAQHHRRNPIDRRVDPEANAGNIARGGEWVETRLLSSGPRLRVSAWSLSPPISWPPEWASTLSWLWPAGRPGPRFTTGVRNPACTDASARPCAREPGVRDHPGHRGTRYLPDGTA